MAECFPSITFSKRIWRELPRTGGIGDLSGLPNGKIDANRCNAQNENCCTSRTAGHGSYPPHQEVLRARARMGTETASAKSESTVTATIVQGRQGFRRCIRFSNAGHYGPFVRRKAMLSIYFRDELIAVGKYLDPTKKTWTMPDPLRRTPSALILRRASPSGFRTGLHNQAHSSDRRFAIHFQEDS